MNLAEIVEKLTGQSGQITALRTELDAVKAGNQTLKDSLVSAEQKISALTPAASAAPALAAEQSAHVATKTLLTDALAKSAAAETRANLAEQSGETFKAELTKAQTEIAAKPADRMRVLTEFATKLGIAPIKGSGQAAAPGTGETLKDKVLANLRNMAAKQTAN